MGHWAFKMVSSLWMQGDEKGKGSEVAEEGGE